MRGRGEKGLLTIEKSSKGSEEIERELRWVKEMGVWFFGVECKKRQTELLQGSLFSQERSTNNGLMRSVNYLLIVI